MSETETPAPTGFAALSEREFEVAIEVANGLSAKAIAEKLGRTVKTVEFHKGSIYRKLNVANVAQLARLAVAHKLVPVEYEVPASE